MLKVTKNAGSLGHPTHPALPKASDAVTVLTLYLVVLLVVPSDRRVAALGGAGAPAGLFALASLLWWCWHHIQHPHAAWTRRFQPVRTAMFVYCAAVAASYATASLSALPATDISVADMGLLRVAAFAGILLVANDGVPSGERFLVLIRRLCLLAGLYAGLGLVQFFSGVSIVDSIQIPGLTSSAVGGTEARAGFIRADATAMHPLEYAMVLVMALPFCLTVALYDKKRSAFLRWFPVAAIALSSVLSVTRSALLGLVAVVLVLMPTWPRAARRGMMAAFAVVIVGVYVAVPGMMGTIVGMFSGGSSSVSSRTSSYDTVVGFVELSPFFGRGFGTFLPSYRILDNQYLSAAIETGLVGIIALLLVIACAGAVAFAGSRREPDPLLKHLGTALLASTIGGGLLTAFFDCFAFPQACGMLFLVLGLCGAYWNLTRNSVPAKPEAAP